MATLAFLLLGIVASLRIPTALMPDIAIPEITVQLTYPNSTARELETNVVRTLRNQLLQVSNLVHIETQTRDGFATLKLQFEFGTDTDYAFIETNEKLDASLNYLPKDLDRPRVIKASATDIPIVNLTVSLKEDYSDERFLEISNFTETVLRKRIEQLPDIALADMSGHTKAEIIITTHKDQLLSTGISNEELIQVIKSNNFELGNLLVQNGIYQYNFKFSNPIRTKEDIENIHFNLNEKIFQLKDVATVSLVPQQERGLVYYNGKRSIVLAIIKQADARVYNLKEELQKLTESFNNDYPQLEFNTNQDQSKLLKLSIENLKSSLWIGITLAILIMFFFLKDFKSPLIIAISIPVSLIVSLFLMYICGLSINIISLSGLILGVGMMIDNAIIVVDNITQKLETHDNLLEACVRGTNEIITPLISSVLTTCSVFLPLLFLSGITGALFYDQAIAVSIGLGSSLLVSIIVIPVIYRILKNKNFRIEKWFQLTMKSQKIENWYEKGYHYFFRKKWIVYTISFVGVVLSIVLFNIMSYSQLPDLSQNETILAIDWNENITIDENQERLQTVFENISGVQARFSKVGEQQFLLQRENVQSFSEANVYVSTNTPADIERIKKEITQTMGQLYGTSVFSFSPPKNIFEYIFGTDKSELTAHIYSKGSLEVPNETLLSEIDTLLATSSVTQIPLKQTSFIQVLHEKIVLYDVDYEDLIQELKTSFNQNFIDDLKTSQKFIPIKFSYENNELKSALNQLFVQNKNNEYIAVRNLIKINNIEQYKTINADRSGEFLAYDVEPEGTVEQQMEALQTRFSASDYNLRFSGSWLSTKSLGSELLVVVLVAIFLLYFIMAAQFESLWQPLIILLEIPIDIGGALLLLWLFGGTINIMAAIGIVVMSGIIINDSILKLHTINMLRKEGHTVDEAIKMGGKLRLKPILMTSLTTILALSPFLIIGGLGAELQRPLAITVIGGMLIGTFISLYFIPLVYSFLVKKFN